jgi:hypothetical protein
MDARPVAGKWVRLIGALAYASSTLALVLWLLPDSAATLPLLFIALGLPLVFRLVPRNYLYGTRTMRSLRTTEEIWYRQNVITGVFMVGIGVIWLVVVGLRSVNS